jgi:tetratricopeptide (TPR) repeat protein
MWQTVAPSGLSVVYTLPALGPWWWLVLVVLTVAAWQLVRGLHGRQPYLEGVVWALVFLLPAAIGLHDGQGHVNDRSTMLPSIGVALIAGAFAQMLLVQQQGRFARLVKVSAVLGLAFLGTLASIQSEAWSNSTALWTAATDRSPTSALAHNYLGAALAEESGDLVRAEQSFTIALYHDPTMAAAFANRGATRAALGREAEGLHDLDEALRLERNDAPARMLRASILRRSGRRAEALRDMHLALAQHPMNIAWMVERVELLLEMGRTGEAAAEMEVLRRAGYDVNVGLK